MMTKRGSRLNNDLSHSFLNFSMVDSFGSKSGGKIAYFCHLAMKYQSFEQGNLFPDHSYRNDDKKGVKTEQRPLSFISILLDG